MPPLTRLCVPTVGAALAATLGAGLLVAPAAQAAPPDQRMVYVKRVKPIQTVSTTVSIKDHRGRNYPIKVSVTFRYLGPKSAQMRTIVLREAGFPKNGCIYPDLALTTSSWKALRNKHGILCDGGHKAYTVMRTLTVRQARNLGQLWIRTPNPSHPGCCGARQYTIQYNIAAR
ncbi:hypothetical protein [Nonomuraea rubra]|uniref:Uncharacterized protein n=1 Tax=Nonomuraea rubra TaxID=46180 RepID=A0A7X0NZP6_9ACTN|nr:hypothetical protein [Nonomuraea rubra]MBB6552409.1 hypothetical protein [Nonomuraea rubra]